MSLIRPLCHLVLLLCMIVMNDAQPEEPRFKEHLMKVCPKQQTTEELMYNFEVSSLNQCAMRCASDMACKSANLCTSGHTEVCTLSRRFSVNECDNNTANNDCTYLITKTPCLHGGILGTAGNCTCVGSYTGDFCERLYFDCWECPGGNRGEIWIQRGGHPPLMLRCYYRTVYFMNFIPSYIKYSYFPLNKTFERYKSSFIVGSSFLTSGLEALHIATTQAHYTLIAGTGIWNPSIYTLTSYRNFSLGSESERYRLDYSYNSFGPDVFADMKGRPFSAIGNDPEGCAQMYNVAWWYTADCKPPMVYNSNKKISAVNETNPDIFIDADELFLYLVFVGLK